MLTPLWEILGVRAGRRAPKETYHVLTMLGMPIHSLEHFAEQISALGFNFRAEISH